jgi:hypothetical protein
MEGVTVSYIANPRDSRCLWWSVHIPRAFTLGSLDNKTSLRELGYLKKGADIELEEGDAVLDSEENHHRKARGYTVKIGIVIAGTLRWFQPGEKTKANIKAFASPEQWSTLKLGSGDVAACLRLLVACRMGFGPLGTPGTLTNAIAGAVVQQTVTV